MTESKYRRLFDFIRYFEDESVQFCKWQPGKEVKDGVYSMPYCIYDEKLHTFIGAVNDCDILLPNYLNVLGSAIGTSNEALQIIKGTNDLEMLQAILTYYVRQERFCDGTWAQAAENKIFLNILLKLKECLPDDF
ncbi:DUF6508 domain-containing protein [Paenibacillus sp. FJAT-26967]|uniref:DUF6508 domain-containing protein n=1 Tax=Paenibacillus sp. FJAT-26967 TaxID=1729690 RepID=UPI000837C0D0|nr:DUF6508 domain-containing protein [Paenibacillus sp. FJAT-26967]